MKTYELAFSDTLKFDKSGQLLEDFKSITLERALCTEIT